MNLPADAVSAERRPPGQRDLTGAELGPYRVVGWLGAGGMGEVYEVEHRELGRRFALKVLRAELNADRETLTRFHRESRAVARLVSEHIVSIVDASALADGTPYFVMERLYGCDLRRLLTQERVLPVARTAHLAIDACRGLACAHGAGLVHRDLKPENLFLTTRDDGQELCKLLDFGVVKSAHDNSTRPGALLGTTRYMAPEQLGLDVPVSPQTDLFALGVIVYECLVGQSPFEGDTVERVLFKIMSEHETPIRELRPEVPEGLAQLVARALSKQPAARPESALAFLEALLPYTQAPNRGLSSRELRVWQTEPASDSDRELTPRTLDPELRVSLGRARAAKAQRGYGLALAGLAAGLAVGAYGAHRFARPVAANREPAVSAEPPRLPISGAPPSAASPQLASAEVLAPRTSPSPAPEPAPAQRAGKPKPTRPAAPVKSAAPALSYDPQNPYAP
jgi:serine/threonine-protein kinase